jgi:hypothetical protein
MYWIVVHNAEPDSQWDLPHAIELAEKLDAMSEAPTAISVLTQMVPSTKLPLIEV